MLAENLMPTKPQALCHRCNPVCDEICLPGGEQVRSRTTWDLLKPYPFYDSTTVQFYTVLGKWSPVRSGEQVPEGFSRGVP